MTILTTSRLILRPWKESDLEPFAKLNSDSRVMEFFPSILTTEETRAMIARLQTKIEKNGWGFWAVSAPGISDFVGFIGLNPVEPLILDVPFAPAVEVGWRLGFNYWGKGFATEGARACLEFGFNTLNLSEIVSFTAVENRRSRHVMEKIGMSHDPQDDFDHPNVPLGNPLRRHVLYRLGKR